MAENSGKLIAKNSERLRLGVNIDHVATLRNARGEKYPCPIRAAEAAKAAGAHGITAHLREDRRHIRDDDIYRLANEVDLPLNMEMAATEEMLKIALDVKPNACCIVPEKREELTTEGGLDVIGNFDHIKDFTTRLKAAKIRVSLFVDADRSQLDAAKKAGADIVEIHTGSYCNYVGDKREIELNRIVKMSEYTSKIGLECHAGHGLTFDTVQEIAAIPQMVELNIGHFLIADSVFSGLENSIGKMLKLMN